MMMMTMKMMMMIRMEMPSQEENEDDMPLDQSVTDVGEDKLEDLQDDQDQHLPPDIPNNAVANIDPPPLPEQDNQPVDPEPAEANDPGDTAERRAECKLIRLEIDNQCPEVLPGRTRQQTRDIRLG
ncbi:MAG TPA: hypothetical protein V6D20_08565, partial [Candidatus Obscuribacterales bacterium]